MKTKDEILKETPGEYNWTEKPVIGLVLINAVHDSNRLLIEPFAFYDVAKHKSGMIVIVA